MSSGSNEPGRPTADAPADDPVAEVILGLLAGLPAGKSISPEDAARAFAEARRRPSDPPDLWRRYLPSVRQQALHLARRGRIAILRKGKPVDPNAPVKGVIRLAASGPPAEQADSG
jgi:hypothetical protein